MDDRNFVRTLKGLGPEITLQKVKERAPVVVYERELARFDWIVCGIQQWGTKIPLPDQIAILVSLERSPGALERAIVGLALSNDEVARLALLDFQPPKGLEVLHQIAILRASYPS